MTDKDRIRILRREASRAARYLYEVSGLLDGGGTHEHHWTRNLDSGVGCVWRGLKHALKITGNK